MCSCPSLKYRPIVDIDELRARTARITSGRPGLLVVDHAATLLFVVLIVVTYLEPTLAGDEGNPAFRPIDVWWLLLGLVGAVALVLRRRYPLTTVVAVIVVVQAVALAPYDVDPIAWMVYVAAFALGRYASLRRALFGLAVFAVLVAVSWFSDQALTATGVAFVLAFFTLAWLAGREMG